jgi:hypothetical protein
MKFQKSLMRSGLAALLIILSACAYPTTKVEQGGKQTAIYVANAPADAHLYVDGVDAGLAQDFDGVNATLAVTPGRHRIELRAGPTQILEKEVYLGKGMILEVVAN